MMIKSKKLLIITLVLIALLCTISVINAKEPYKSNTNSKLLFNNTLILDNVSFNIPFGFNEVSREHDTTNSSLTIGEDIDGMKVDSLTKMAFKKGYDELSIEVGSITDKRIDKLNVTGGQQKNINGKDGYFFREADSVKFDYLDNGRIVKIEASNEDLLNDVVL